MYWGNSRSDKIPGLPSFLSPLKRNVKLLGGGPRTFYVAPILADGYFIDAS